MIKQSIVIKEKRLARSYYFPEKYQNVLLLQQKFSESVSKHHLHKQQLTRKTIRMPMIPKTNSIGRVFAFPHIKPYIFKKHALEHK